MFVPNVQLSAVVWTLPDFSPEHLPPLVQMYKALIGLSLRVSKKVVKSVLLI